MADSDRPRLRPLEVFPVTRDGQKMLALRDPSGLTDAVAALPPQVVAIVQLLDGTATRDEICEQFTARHRMKLERAVLDRLLEQLDEALLLDSERFRAHSAEVFASFGREPVRAAHLAGKSYPGDPGELAEFLDAAFAPPKGPGLPAPNATRERLPRALVVPHIDFHRGGSAYAWAYRPLMLADAPPERIVIFGTNHNGVQPFSLTRKHYDTPFGRLDTDVALVEELTARVKAKLGEAAEAALYADEYHHRGEHSIEFQAVWIRHALKERAAGVKIIPILCGSYHEHVEGTSHPHEDELISTVIRELSSLVSDGRTLFIAGADLAHVGPRFGDRDPLDSTDRDSLERRDRETLEAVTSGDARLWFDEIKRERDQRRVCGLSPIYSLLACARPQLGNGRVLAYGQCAADEQAGSLVSIASVLYPA